jgi:hypothetical protein
MKAFEFDAKGGGGYAKYDWDKLLNGETWRLSSTEVNPRDDETGHTTIVRFRRTAHAAASSRNLKLQTQILDDTYLVIQARPTE